MTVLSPKVNLKMVSQRLEFSGFNADATQVILAGIREFTQKLLIPVKAAGSLMDDKYTADWQQHLSYTLIS